MSGGRIFPATLTIAVGSLDREAGRIVSAIASRFTATNASGTFDVVWRSISPIKASVWSRYLPDSAKRIADWTFAWVCGGCTEPTFKDW